VLLLQPKRNNFTSDSIQGRLGYLSVCAIASRSYTPSHVCICNGHPGSELCCGNCIHSYQLVSFRCCPNLTHRCTVVWAGSDSITTAARSLRQQPKTFTQLLVPPGTSLLHYRTLINIERRVQQKRDQESLTKHTYHVHSVTYGLVLRRFQMSGHLWGRKRWSQIWRPEMIQDWGFLVHAMTTVYASIWTVVRILTANWNKLGNVRIV
jgi:hypothetical protein